MLDNNLDTSEVYIKELSKMIVNLYKLCFEEMGYDLGDTNNDVEYHNYLWGDPIHLYSGKDASDYDHDPTGLLFMGSGFKDYDGPTDGSIGSPEFPQGKGKTMDPNGQYWPFYTFGFGASPKARPNQAYSMRSGVDCCKLAVETLMGYVDKGCKTVGDAIVMYHTGHSTYEKFYQYAITHNYKDIADGRTVTGNEMIQRQNYYQRHLVNYIHMSRKTPLNKSYEILFPLITFISRQEQGVNCEEACKIALKQMNIT